MTELVIMKDRQAVTTSTKVAEVFGKRHDNVLGTIKNLEKDVLNFKEMFFESVEADSYGRDRKIYLMNRDGFTLLAMGFTGKKALQFKIDYINKFNELEQENSRLAIDNQDLHQIATDDTLDDKERKYQADVKRYSWHNIKTVLQQADYKTIADEVDNIIDFHTNELKKKDRANYPSHRQANKTEYKQIVRDRVFDILDEVYSTTLDGVLRAVTGELRLELTQDKLSTHKRSTGRVIANKDKEIDSLKPPTLDEYIELNIHPFSYNYMYDKVDGRQFSTPAYLSWQKRFPAFSIPSLKQLGVDKKKPIELSIAFIAKEGYDTDNIIKSLQDRLFGFKYQMDDYNVHIGSVNRIGTCQTFDEGKIYIHLRNIEERVAV